MSSGEGESRFWFWMLLALGVTYLCFEMAFNTQLLDVVGTVPNAIDVHRLEVEGRMISASGVTLVAFSFIARGLAKGRFWRSVAKLVAVAAIAAPLMFFGEKALITVLAKDASKATRQHASDMLILKKGMAEGVVHIKGVPYTGRHPSPTDKTFLALSGVMVFADPPFLDEVAARRKQIVSRTARAVADRQVGTDYHKYRQAVRRINHAYDRYYRAYRKYLHVEHHPRHIALEKWAQANQRILDAYHQYQHGERGLKRRAKIEAKRIRPKLKEFFQYRSDCFTNRCRANMDKRYHKAAAKAISDPPPWTFWCDQKMQKKHGFTLFTYDNNHGGQTPVRLGWGKKVGTGHYVCNLGLKSIEKHVYSLGAKRFRKRTGMWPGKDYPAFLTSPVVRKKFVREARKRGVHLPPDWSPTDEKTFLKKAEAAVRREARHRYIHGIRKASGHYIRPGLSRTQFQHLPFIQARARKELHWHHRRPVSFHMSERRFQHEVVLPQAHREGMAALHKMESKRSRLGLGEKYDQTGRSYVTDVIVPPIALTFSLFFGLWNALNLAKDLVFGVTKFHPRRRIKAGIAVATLAAIAVTPFFVHNKMTDSPAYQRMLSQSHQTLGPAAWPFGWIMRAEPAVYPVGAKVRDGITVADRAAKTELTRLRRCTSGGHIKQCASGSRNSRKALF